MMGEDRAVPRRPVVEVVSAPPERPVLEERRGREERPVPAERPTGGGATGTGGRGRGAGGSTGAAGATGMGGATGTGGAGWIAGHGRKQQHDVRRVPGDPERQPADAKPALLPVQHQGQPHPFGPARSELERQPHRHRLVHEQRPEVPGDSRQRFPVPQQQLVHGGDQLDDACHRLLERRWDHDVPVPHGLAGIGSHLRERLLLGCQLCGTHDPPAPRRSSPT